MNCGRDLYIRAEEQLIVRIRLRWLSAVGFGHRIGSTSSCSKYTIDFAIDSFRPPPSQQYVKITGEGTCAELGATR